MSTLYYTFGVGTAKVMREQLAKMKLSETLVCIIPPKEYLLPMPPQDEEEIKAALSDSRLILIGESSYDRSVAALRQRAAVVQYMDAVEYIDIGIPLKEHFPKQDWMEAVENQFHQILNMTAMLINTNRVSIRNYFLNAYESLAYQNWDSVASKIDRPLVIIGMGPSMAKEIKTLRSLVGKVFIVATDNAVRFLMHHGIAPDFVAQVEWQPRSLDFYHEVDLPKKCTLIALPGASPDAIHFWKGPKLFMPNYQIHGVFDKFINSTTQPFFGTNVGTLAIQFAARVKAKEAWLVGFDFGSPQASYFHPGSVSLHEVYPTVSRFWSVQKMDFIYNWRQQETQEAEDRTGKPMWVATSFESDKKNIELMMTTCETKYFNVSEFGRQIVGAEYRPLTQLISNAPKAEYGSAAPDPYPLDEQALAETCDAKLSQLEQYDKLSATILQAANNVLMLQEHGHKVDTAIRELEVAVLALQGTTFNWIEGTLAVLDPGVRHIFTAETIALKDLPTKSERLLAWAKNIQEFYPHFTRYHSFISDFLKHVKTKAKS